MKVEIKSYRDDWQIIKDNAMFTIHKDTGKYPNSEWKMDMLLCEHSPIRSGHLIINCYDVPSFVIGHIVRHNIGFTPFVATLRNDRWETDEVPNRNTPNSLRFDGNFQSFINITRRRCCHQSSPETVWFWEMVLNAIREYEPELFWACVPECIYRGGCPEKKVCSDFIWGKFLKFVGNNDLPKLLNLKYRYSEYHRMKENDSYGVTIKNEQ